MMLEEKNANLRRALSQCLESLHNYFGLTEAVMKVALDEAERDPNWSYADEDKWSALAYPRDDRTAGPLNSHPS